MIYEQTGIMPEELASAALPIEVEHIWEYFQALSAKRAYTAAGPGGVVPNPLSEVEIEAWERRRCIRLTPFEIECIDALDAAYLSHQHKQK